MDQYGGQQHILSSFSSFIGGIWTPDMKVKRLQKLPMHFSDRSLCILQHLFGNVPQTRDFPRWFQMSLRTENPVCNGNRMIVLLSRLIGGVMSGTSKRGALFYGKSILIVGAVLEHKHCEKQLWLKPPTWGRLNNTSS